MVAKNKQKEAPDEITDNENNADSASHPFENENADESKTSENEDFNDIGEIIDFDNETGEER